MIITVVHGEQYKFMKYFPPKNQDYTYLQTNRSDDLGSLWSTFNLDFQSNLGTMRLAQKLVTTTTSTDDADLGRASAFQFCFGVWWAVCGNGIFSTADNLVTTAFTQDNSAFTIGASSTQFDVTNPAGITFRYTYDGTGTDPSITALTFPVGATVVISGTNLAAGNRGTFTVTGSGANYFEVSNAAGVAEVDKTIGSGSIAVTGGSFGTSFDPETSDLATFDNRLWVSTTYGLYSRVVSSSVWTLRHIFSTGNTSHKLVYFKKFDRLYFKDSTRTVLSINDSNVVATSGTDYAINLGDSIGRVSTLATTSDSVWIGTRINDTVSSFGNTNYAVILQWDGISAQATDEYTLTAAGCEALVVQESIVYAVDSEAIVLKYTGSSFDEIARLPVDRVLLTDAAEITTTNGRFIHYNGFVATKNNTLLLLINNLFEDNGNTISENCQSGIWELDLNTYNFTHRYSFTLKPLTSTTITDFGQNRILGAGALKMNTLSTNSSLGRATLICGASYYTSASATASAIFIDSPAKPDTDKEGQKRGYFVTTWFNSDEIQDKWTRLWTTFRRFLNSTDKIVFKYRLNEVEPIEATITWTSTTTFTTTTNVSAYGPTATGFNGTTGGEVEVVQGTGSGSCTHISGISEAGGTYTVTLDNAVTGVSGTAKARFQKWIKLFPEITGQVLSYGSTAIGGSNTRIQIKGVMEFTGDDEFHKLAIWSNEDIKISA